MTPIEKNTFINADDETRRAITFDLLKDIQNQVHTLNDRLQKVESCKAKMIGITAGISATIGAASSLLAIFKFWD